MSRVTAGATLRALARGASPALIGLCAAVTLAASAATPTESTVQPSRPRDAAASGAPLLGLPPGFSPVDGESLAAMAAWLEFAARPTSTPTATHTPAPT
ncbi:MAG TPA: hypothetical protein VNM91_10160, partial [Dehalococcoidia bacterium]|nr:hypothetical protein [Dehalococcoidia bacterium]